MSQGCNRNTHPKVLRSFFSSLVLGFGADIASHQQMFDNHILDLGNDFSRRGSKIISSF